MLSNIEEVWKDVLGYEGLYQVSNRGRVKSLDRLVKNTKISYRVLKGQIIQPAVSTSGYFQVGMHKEGKSCHKQVHQLVAIAFLDHTPKKYSLVVDHIDTDKLNNKIENLQIISVRENSSKDKVGYSSAYIGVMWFKNKKKWKAGIKINGKSLHLGYFHNEIEASETYQKRLTEFLDTGF